MRDSIDFKDWLEKAGHNLRAAEALSALYCDRLADGILFHCHQVAEKSFKAFLLAKTKSMKRTTELNGLLRHCVKVESDFMKFQAFAFTLNRYYIAAQYPPAEPLSFPQEEAQTALNQAREIFAFTRTKLITTN